MLREPQCRTPRILSIWLNFGLLRLKYFYLSYLQPYMLDALAPDLQSVKLAAKLLYRASISQLESSSSFAKFYPSFSSSGGIVGARPSEQVGSGKTCPLFGGDKEPVEAFSASFATLTSTEEVSRSPSSPCPDVAAISDTPPRSFSFNKATAAAAPVASTISESLNVASPALYQASFSSSDLSSLNRALMTSSIGAGLAEPISSASAAS